MLHSADGSINSPSCVCSQPRSSHCSSTLDDVSEEVEEDDDEDVESSCSPNCDCQHSSSSTCHSPTTESDGTRSTRSRKRGAKSDRQPQPFYLHPCKNADVMTNAKQLVSTKSSFYMNPVEQLENRKNQNLNTDKYQSSRCESQPFYLHDPNSIVYTRVRELFGCDNQSKKQHVKKKLIDEEACSVGSSEVSFSTSTQDSETIRSTDSCSTSSAMTTSQAESTSESGSESPTSSSNDDDHNNNLVQSNQQLSSEYQVSQ